MHTAPYTDRTFLELFRKHIPQQLRAVQYEPICLYIFCGKYYVIHFSVKYTTVRTYQNIRTHTNICSAQYYFFYSYRFFLF